MNRRNVGIGLLVTFLSFSFFLSARPAMAIRIECFCGYQEKKVAEDWKKASVIFHGKLQNFRGEKDWEISQADVQVVKFLKGSFSPTWSVIAKEDSCTGSNLGPAGSEYVFFLSEEQKSSTITLYEPDCGSWYTPSEVYPYARWYKAINVYLPILVLVAVISGSVIIFNRKKIFLGKKQ